MSACVRLKTQNGETSGPQTGRAYIPPSNTGGGGIPKRRFKGINPWTVFKALEVILISLLHVSIN